METDSARSRTGPPPRTTSAARLRRSSALNMCWSSRTHGAYAQDAVKEEVPPEAVCCAHGGGDCGRHQISDERLFRHGARRGVGYTGGAVPVEGGMSLHGSHEQH